MTASVRILLVDDDPGARDLAGAVLGVAGHSVTTAGDGREGLEKAVASPPDIVVTDVQMPVVDGWAFARSLRSHPRTALVPIVFLTALDSPDDVLQGFSLGADDYLPKSSALSELPRVVARVVARRLELQEMVDHRGSTAFRGDLEKLGLPAVLFLLESVAKTGTLRVSSPRGHAVLYLREGAVIGAELRESGVLRDAHLVYHATTWTRGDFEFVDGPVSGDDAIRMSTPELLLEAARRQDEAAV